MQRKVRQVYPCIHDAQTKQEYLKVDIAIYTHLKKGVYRGECKYQSKIEYTRKKSASENGGTRGAEVVPVGTFVPFDYKRGEENEKMPCNQKQKKRVAYTVDSSKTEISGTCQ